MANTFFQFKRFGIDQDKCAMKVSTDSCILGAVADASKARNLLDIGTGTGLLSLMMAQRFPLLQIDAVEIDEAAAKQAKENFGKSPWPGRIAIIAGDIKKFALNHKKYDHVICNPPFYEDHLKPADKTNRIARHTEQLPLSQLASIVPSLLSPAGKFTVLLHPEGMKRLERILLSKEMFIDKKFLIQDRIGLPVIRVISEFTFNNALTETTELVIKKNKEEYTDEFKMLLKDFYLAF